MCEVSMLIFKKICYVLSWTIPYRLRVYKVDTYPLKDSWRYFSREKICRFCQSNFNWTFAKIGAWADKDGYSCGCVKIKDA